MKKSLPLILTISILFKGCINAKESPQPKNLTLNHKVAIQRVDSLLTSFDFYKRFSGTVLIAHADSIWYSNSFGYGDYEKDQKNSDGSVYGIASCTKQFTAAAILKLVQNGKINLNDNLFSFFPRLGSESQKITIHNLLSHSSGISKDIGRGDTWDEIVFPQADPISMDSLIHFFCEITLDFTPGNKFDYNNHNYVLLAGIIEKVSGMDYQSYMKTNFFNPLNLKSTFFNQINRGDNQISKPYNNLPLSYGQPEFWDDSWETGAGGIYSSAYDIYKWLKDLNRNRVLSPELTGKMFESYQPIGKEYYGYGWQIADLFNNKYVYHDGGLNGYYCKIGFVPSQQVYVIVLSNHTHNLMELGNTSRFIGNINKQILNILFDQPYEKLPVPVAESQQDMNGRVEINGKTFLVSSPKSKTLSLQAEGDYSVFDLPFTKSFSEKSKRFRLLKK